MAQNSNLQTTKMDSTVIIHSSIRLHKLINHAIINNCAPRSHMRLNNNIRLQVVQVVYLKWFIAPSNKPRIQSINLNR